MVKNSSYIAAEMEPILLHALRGTKTVFIEPEESQFSYFRKEEERVLKWGITVPLLYMKKFTDFFFNDGYIAQLTEHYLHETNREKHFGTVAGANKSAKSQCWIFYRGFYLFPHSLLGLKNWLRD